MCSRCTWRRGGSFAERAEARTEGEGERRRVGMRMERLRRLKEKAGERRSDGWRRRSTQFRSSQAAIHQLSIHLHGRIANAESASSARTTTNVEPLYIMRSIREASQTRRRALVQRIPHAQDALVF